VDLVIGMVVPSELDDNHYAVIKTISGVLADEGFRSRLRSANSSKDLYEALINGSEFLRPAAPQEAQES
jgi:PTS system nitrogen regulatory IIA component